MKSRQTFLVIATLFLIIETLYFTAETLYQYDFLFVKKYIYMAKLDWKLWALHICSIILNIIEIIAWTVIKYI